MAAAFFLLAFSLTFILLYLPGSILFRVDSLLPASRWILTHFQGLFFNWKILRV
jgi:hypothetical protein